MTSLPWIKVGSLCFLYITISGALITLNKYIVNEKRFPHPMVLTALHMLVSTVLCGAFYVIKPSMYPGVERTAGKRLELLKMLIPIGCLFAIMLYGSNSAYLYCGVAFLQFMKEANVVLVFLLSCLAGLQSMNRQRMVVIAWIIAGSSLCVSGDMHFALLGFLFQAMSQVSECCRAVMAEMILVGHELKLDPLTYTMYVSPICLVILGVGAAASWTPDIWADCRVWWPVLLPNACLAFVLNVIIALVITEVSAVGFVIVGVTKDIALVVLSVLVFQDDISGKQCASFVITLTGIFVWSFMKVQPDHPLVLRFETMLGVVRVPEKPAEVDPESLPLLTQDKRC